MGTDLAGAVFHGSAGASDWTPLALDGSAPSEVPWTYEARMCDDREGQVQFLSSFPRGERQTGILRSRTFVIPSKLSLFVCGHNGELLTNPPAKNLVRLCAADTHEVLAQTPAPRNDTARRVEWDLHDRAGRSGYIEVVDGDDSPSYAWIAFARLEPPVVAMPAISPSALAVRLQLAASI